MKSDADAAAANATRETYLALQGAYDFLNERLFDGELPGALITLQRSGRSFGHYSAGRYVNRAKVRADEINMNPAFFATRPVEDTLSTLAHEMVHQWRDRNGEPPRRCYHDKKWSAKMIEVGLHPSSTGKPGGKVVGESMSHYVMPEGAFILACKELLTASFGIVWFDRFPIASGKDYGYAPNATVTIAKQVIQAAQLSARQASQQAGDPQQPTDHEEGGDGTDVRSIVEGLDASQDAEVPLFSPSPVEAGVDVELASRSYASVDAGAGPRAKDSSNRVKYSCPGCKTNIWGKPSINVDCGDCKRPYAPT